KICSRDEVRSTHLARCGEVHGETIEQEPSLRRQTDAAGLLSRPPLLRPEPHEVPLYLVDILCWDSFDRAQPQPHLLEARILVPHNLFALQGKRAPPDRMSICFPIPQVPASHRRPEPVRAGPQRGIRCPCPVDEVVAGSVTLPSEVRDLVVLEPRLGQPSVCVQVLARVAVLIGEDLAPLTHPPAERRRGLGGETVERDVLRLER